MIINGQNLRLTKNIHTQMKRILITLLSLLALSSTSFVFGQLTQEQNQTGQLPTGQWQSHLSYLSGQRLAKSENKVYCVASGNLFSYSINDNAIETYNTTNGLSDVYINDIAYCTTLKTLVICYSNGNIDLMTEDGIINIPDLKQKAVFGTKTINKIDIVNGKAYISTDLGILNLNIERAEISETYQLTNGDQNPTKGVAILDNSIYAATANGLYKADINNINLQNFTAWSLVSISGDSGEGVAGIISFADHIIIAQHFDKGYHYKAIDKNMQWQQINSSWLFYGFSSNDERLLIACSTYFKVHNEQLTQINSINSYNFETKSFPNQNDIHCGHAIPDGTDTYWIADSYSGLVRYNINSNSTNFQPSGPASNEVWDIDISNNIVRVVPGGTTYDINNTWHPGSISTYNSSPNEISSWTYLASHNGGENYQDYLRLLTDPSDNNHYYVSTYGRGILEYQDDQLINRYTEDNSTIENAIPTSPRYVRTYGMAFDSKGNLWTDNCDVNTQIHAMTPEGKWVAIKSKLISSVIKYSDIVITDNDIKWIVTPYFGNGILIYDDNNTLEDVTDDKEKYFNIYAYDTDNNAEYVSKKVETLEIDNDGTMWVGCDHGVVLYYNPSDVFESTSNPVASRINIPRNDGTGLGDYLLSEEVVQDIAVDGSNRKWLATKSSGVMLVSSDGLEIIHHFTRENSPLFANNVKTVEINQETGEVFFGTEAGLISYQADATTAEDDFSNIKIYPNPVREDYFGDITITGLVDETIVKITNVSGDLVNQTTSNGGTATWDGTNFYGKRVGTGVYLIFCSDKTGERSGMTKVMLVN